MFIIEIGKEKNQLSKWRKDLLSKFGARFALLPAKGGVLNVLRLYSRISSRIVSKILQVNTKTGRCGCRCRLRWCCRGCRNHLKLNGNAPDSVRNGKKARMCSSWRKLSRHSWG
ncbi:hypothetical protein V6Z11_A11G285300 [Gossypium hirsutum]